MPTDRRNTTDDDALFRILETTLDPDDLLAYVDAVRQLNDARPHVAARLRQRARENAQRLLSSLDKAPTVSPEVADYGTACAALGESELALSFLGLTKLYLDALRARASTPRRQRERQLQEYLVEHLSDLEVGLEYLGMEVWLATGRLDILARDVQRSHVFLELKGEDYDPDKLVGQARRYFSELRRLAPSLPARAILVVPHVDHSLWEGLADVISSGHIVIVLYEKVGRSYRFERLNQPAPPPPSLAAKIPLPTESSTPTRRKGGAPRPRSARRLAALPKATAGKPASPPAHRVLIQAIERDLIPADFGRWLSRNLDLDGILHDLSLEAEFWGFFTSASSTREAQWKAWSDVSDQLSSIGMGHSFHFLATQKALLTQYLELVPKEERLQFLVVADQTLGDPKAKDIERQLVDDGLLAYPITDQTDVTSLLASWLEFSKRCKSTLGSLRELSGVKGLKSSANEEYTHGRRYPGQGALYARWLQRVAYNADLPRSLAYAKTFSIVCAKALSIKDAEIRAHYLINLADFIGETLMSPEAGGQGILAVTTVVEQADDIAELCRLAERWTPEGKEYIELLTHNKNLLVRFEHLLKPTLLSIIQERLEEHDGNELLSPDTGLADLGETVAEVKVALDRLRRPLSEELYELSSRDPDVARMIFRLVAEERLSHGPAVLAAIRKDKRSAVDVINPDELVRGVAALSAQHAIRKLLRQRPEFLQNLEILGELPAGEANALIHDLARNPWLWELDPADRDRFWSWVRAGQRGIAQRFLDNASATEGRILLSLSLDESQDGTFILNALDTLHPADLSRVSVDQPIAPQLTALLQEREHRRRTHELQRDQHGVLASVATVSPEFASVLGAATAPFSNELPSLLGSLAQRSDLLLPELLSATRELVPVQKRADFLVVLLEKASWSSFLDAKHGKLRTPDGVKAFCVRVIEQYANNPERMSKKAIKQVYHSLPEPSDDPVDPGPEETTE